MAFREVPNNPGRLVIEAEAIGEWLRWQEGDELPALEDVDVLFVLDEEGN